LASAEPVVRFQDVHLDLGGKPVLRGLTLNVDPGETVVLLGRSGSGKTSALRLINALLTASRGEVLVFGKRIADWEPVSLRRKIGYVIQGIGLFPHFTVARNIGLVPELEGWPEAERRDRIAELLSLVGLPDYADRHPRQLSGGQQQRVGIARALAARPPLLLLDEPFGALDPETRAEMQDEFLRLREALGMSAVFVTHDLQEARRVGTRIVELRDGIISG
jgi:osmoprotectant transport system ATP-binding protein